MLDKDYILTHEDELREAVIVEARKWLGANYHVMAQLKYKACDCMTLLIEVFSAVGLIDWFKAPHYSPDFLFHRRDEVYLNGLLERSRRTNKYDKGNIILYKMGRIVSHSAIIVDYPLIIHAAVEKGCILDDAEQSFLKDHEFCKMSLWEDK